jgi:hypothetical protein
MPGRVRRPPVAVPARRGGPGPEGAQGDPREDGHAADGERKAERVVEDRHGGGRAHERLEVDEGAGQLRVHARLAVCVQRERDQRARDGEGQHRAELRRGGRAGRRSARQRRRQREERRGGHLHGRHGHGVAAAEEPALGDDEARADDRRGQDERVAGGRGVTASAGDSADADQGDEAARPGRRARRPAAAERRDHGDQRRHRAEDQRAVAHARALHPHVLQQHHAAVAHRAPHQDGPARRAAQGAPGDERQHGRRQGEARGAEPGGVEPAEGQLGERDGEAEQDAGRGQRPQRAAPVGVARARHVPSVCLRRKMPNAIPHIHAATK